MSKPIDHTETHVTIESPEDGAIDLLQRATGLSRQRINWTKRGRALWATEYATPIWSRGIRLHPTFHSALVSSSASKPVRLVSGTTS